MPKFRQALPQLSSQIFLTDGGLETTLIFLKGFELPDFAAFTLLATPNGTDALRSYYRSYLDIAQRYDTGFILEAATWRANADWGKRLGYSTESLAKANQDLIDMLVGFRTAEGPPVVISGCIGPRGDGYVAGEVMSIDEADAYHSEQINTFASTEADMVSAITMTNVPESIGIATAARSAEIPVSISFTVETDGKLPTGQSLRSAIESVDQATDGSPAYYMINCAHPTHFNTVFEEKGSWVDRIRGLRANASTMSHGELDEAPELDEGNPAELGLQYADLRRILPNLNVLGGCCGTDERHIEQIAKACLQ